MRRFVILLAVALCAAAALTASPALVYELGWSACANPTLATCDSTVSADSLFKVFDYGEDRCGVGTTSDQVKDYPDTALHGFRFLNRTLEERVQFSFSGSIANRRLVGTNLDTIKREHLMDPPEERRECGWHTGPTGPPEPAPADKTKDIVMDSHANPDPANFDFAEWIVPYFIHDDIGRGVAVAIIHDEFHGALVEDHCPGGPDWCSGQISPPHC